MSQVSEVGAGRQVGAPRISYENVQQGRICDELARVGGRAFAASIQYSHKLQYRKSRVIHSASALAELRSNDDVA